MTPDQHADHLAFMEWAVKRLPGKRMRRAKGTNFNCLRFNRGKLEFIYHAPLESSGEGIYLFVDGAIGGGGLGGEPELRDRLESIRRFSQSIRLDLRDRANLAILLSYQIP